MNGSPDCQKLESVQNANQLTGIEKKCKCGNPNAEFYNSMSYRCKECHNKLVNKWKQEHPEKGREWAARYRKNNPEKAEATSKEAKRKRILLHGIEDKKRKAEYDKLYCQKNKEKKINQIRNYYLKNKEVILKANKQYRKTSIGKLSHNNSNHKRRTITKTGNVNTIELRKIFTKTKKCYWCGCNLNKKTGKHIDHYNPLSAGGKHNINNLVITCANCNLCKNKKDPLIFAQTVGRLC